MAKGKSAKPTAFGTKAPIRASTKTSTQLLPTSSSQLPNPTTVTTTTRRRNLKKAKSSILANAENVKAKGLHASPEVPSAQSPLSPLSTSANIKDAAKSLDTTLTPSKRSIAPMSASPHKKPRLEGSFSPASPPYHLAHLAKSAEQNSVIFHPNTPTSPPYMSSASQSQSHGEIKEVRIEQDKADVEMEDAQGTSHRRTDHERQGGELLVEKAPMEELFFSISDPLTRSRPHHSQNLLSLYNLDALASSVARTDPVTGEKINKLRKSYEGQVKLLHLSGKNKPSSRLGEMTGMHDTTEEAWKSTVGGSSLMSAQPLGDDLLARAMSMRSGSLTAQEDRKWRSIVGQDEVTKPKTGLGLVLPQKKLPGPGVAVSTPQSARPSSQPTAQRPQRPGKKRRYDDSSFSGYGETFVDDDMAESTGGEDNGRGGSNKKRRKDFPAGSPLSMNERPGGFSSMVRVNQR